MRRLMFVGILAGKYIAQRGGDDSLDELAISFKQGWRIERRKRIVFAEGFLENSGIDWLRTDGSDWLIDCDRAREQYGEVLQDLDWFTGVIRAQPDIIPGQERLGPFLEFSFYRDEIMNDAKKRIFLSHKGADKALIRRYWQILKTIGFDPWLDTDAMAAGVELERGLLSGFEQSCAAVFFITPNFSDENYLASEINYALAEKRKKGLRFSIITLVFCIDGKKGSVPGLLQQYVWKEPANDLEALEEIIRALPIKLGAAYWPPESGNPSG